VKSTSGEAACGTYVIFVQLVAYFLFLGLGRLRGSEIKKILYELFQP
jgi:hypothetical protein